MRAGLVRASAWVWVWASVLVRVSVPGLVRAEPMARRSPHLGDDAGERHLPAGVLPHRPHHAVVFKACNWAYK